MPAIDRSNDDCRYIEQLMWEQRDTAGGGGECASRAGPSCDGDTAIALAMAAGPSLSPPNATIGRVSPPPPPGHVEVPRCPVCLERLDPHASGILTVLCNHSFHSDCLTKWCD